MAILPLILIFSPRGRRKTSQFPLPAEGEDKGEGVFLR
jgi:hypothetical protein